MRQIAKKAIFLKYKALTVDKFATEQHPDFITVYLPDYSVTVKANTPDILAYNLTTKQWSQIKNGFDLNYQYPIIKWQFVSGNENWIQDIYKDFGWKLPTNVNQGLSSHKQGEYNESSKTGFQ